ncbi:MAG: right-handed parallel beta-helix repeat-containing protein [Candidatus Nanoarchaeia archaeon]|nr:right-handed parallel beta-helix repeat-containing protein [Candidatus Nanoarchaeia archaeon]
MKNKFIILILFVFLFNLKLILSAPDNNLVCTGYPISCEYLNLTAALIGENNTMGSQIKILENNTIYGIDYKSSFNLTTNTAGINITGYNITLDCNGSLITGNQSGYGIYSSNFDNLTIINCDIEKYYYGIIIKNSNNINITNNIVQNNIGTGFGSIKGTGMLFYGVNNSFLINNTVNNSIWGILFYTGNYNNTISYNTMNGNLQHGFQTYLDTANFTITYNNVSYNDDAGLTFFGQQHLVAHNFVSNNIEGGIISYGIYTELDNANTKIINNTVCNTRTGPSGALSPEGYGIKVMDNNYEIINNTLINNSQSGIYLINGNNTVVIGNLIINNSNITNKYDGGIATAGNFIRGPIFNLLIKDNIIINNIYGIYINKTCIYCNISGNNISYSLNGILLNTSKYSNIINNTFNETGNISSYQDYFPIQIINSSYLNITGNTFYNTNLTIKAIGIDSLSYNLTIQDNYFFHQKANIEIYSPYQLQFVKGDCNGDTYIGPPDYAAFTQVMRGRSTSCYYPNRTRRYDYLNIFDFNNDEYIGPPDYIKLIETMKGISPLEYYTI